MVCITVDEQDKKWTSGGSKGCLYIGGGASILTPLILDTPVRERRRRQTSQTGNRTCLMYTVSRSMFTLFVLGACQKSFSFLKKFGCLGKNRSDKKKVVALARRCCSSCLVWTKCEV